MDFCLFKLTFSSVKKNNLSTFSAQNFCGNLKDNYNIVIKIEHLCGTPMILFSALNNTMSCSSFPAKLKKKNMKDFCNRDFLFIVRVRA